MFLIPLLAFQSRDYSKCAWRHRNLCSVSSRDGRTLQRRASSGERRATSHQHYSRICGGRVRTGPGCTEGGARNPLYHCLCSTNYGNCRVYPSCLFFCLLINCQITWLFCFFSSTNLTDPPTATVLQKRREIVANKICNASGIKSAKTTESWWDRLQNLN